jgi:hypothetical protein
MLSVSVTGQNPSFESRTLGLANRHASTDVYFLAGLIFPLLTRVHLASA